MLLCFRRRFHDQGMKLIRQCNEAQISPDKIKIADKCMKKLFTFFVKNKVEDIKEENINSLVEFFKKFNHPIPKPISSVKLESLRRETRKCYEEQNWEHLDIAIKECTALIPCALELRSSKDYRKCLLLKISSEWKKDNKR